MRLNCNCPALQPRYPPPFPVGGGGGGGGGQWLQMTGALLSSSYYHNFWPQTLVTDFLVSYGFKIILEFLCFSDKSRLNYENGKFHFHRIMTLHFVARLLIISNVSN